MRVFGLMFFFLSLPVLATMEIKTQIYDVDYGNKPGDEILILLTSGHVAKMPHDQKAMIETFASSKTKHNWFNFKLDKNRFIKEITFAEPPHFPTEEMETSSSDKGLMSTYVPTTIASMEVAQKYHREARRNPKDSQCFNRGQVWTYEMWKNHSVKSKKIWVYFTRTYIRRYNFEWWFHIAPMVNVMHEGKVVERVMDIKYTRGPIDIQRWTNIFMRNDAVCRVIDKFSDYADYPYTGECYIQRSNMYVYQPADLQMLEAWGYKKDNWRMEEVKAAYLEAFDIHL
jgi:hypothetical protein